MLKFRHTILALVLCAFAGHAMAAPPNDSSDARARVLQLIKVVKRLLLPVAQDEPQPPPPHP